MGCTLVVDCLRICMLVWKPGHDKVGGHSRDVGDVGE